MLRVLFPGWNGEKPHKFRFLRQYNGVCRRRSRFFEGCDIKLSMIRVLDNSANGMAESD